ncbi:hypothetical protein BGY98DRAFT_1018221 [Russula aff. rugulosa BPL654]|nr:hypothetical protein BGY98DRAFT_1018221 [Russula aff. rugulosa BPL654]
MAAPPKLRSPGLHLELLRDPSWKTCILYFPSSFSHMCLFRRSSTSMLFTWSCKVPDLGHNWVGRRSLSIIVVGRPSSFPSICLPQLSALSPCHLRPLLLSPPHSPSAFLHQSSGSSLRQRLAAHALAETCYFYTQNLRDAPPARRDGTFFNRNMGLCEPMQRALRDGDFIRASA